MSETEVPKEPKTYEANCHCGNVKYSVTLPQALAPEGKGKVLRCNCSICTKSGYLLVYPMRKDVVFHGDSESKMKEYFMAKKLKPHRFCPNCGSSILIDFLTSDVENQRPRYAMSVRLFKGLDLNKLDYEENDGWNEIQPQYEL